MQTLTEPFWTLAQKFWPNSILDVSRIYWVLQFHGRVFEELYLEIPTFLWEVLFYNVPDLVGVYNSCVRSSSRINLHHGGNLARSSEFIIFPKHLEKFLSIWNFDFSKVIFTFDFFLWNKLHVMMKYDSWNLIFDLKVKV